MKNILSKGLFLALGVSVLMSSKAVARGGDAMLGSFIGGTAGSMLGTAIATPRGNSSGGSSRDGSGREALRAVDSLERATKADLTILNDRLTKMERKTHTDYEDDIEELKTGHQSHKKQFKSLESKLTDAHTKLDEAEEKSAAKDDKINALEKRITQLEAAAKK